MAPTKYQSEGSPQTCQSTTVVTDAVRRQNPDNKSRLAMCNDIVDVQTKYQVVHKFFQTWNLPGVGHFIENKKLRQREWLYTKGTPILFKVGMDVSGGHLLPYVKLGPGAADAFVAWPVTLTVTCEVQCLLPYQRKSSWKLFWSLEQTVHCVGADTVSLKLDEPELWLTTAAGDKMAMTDLTESKLLKEGYLHSNDCLQMRFSAVAKMSETS